MSLHELPPRTSLHTQLCRGARAEGPERPLFSGRLAVHLTRQGPLSTSGVMDTALVESFQRLFPS